MVIKLFFNNRMSILRRTGTGRNNIDWYNASSNSSGNYLRRTGTSRNNISWLNISTSGTYNLLNRTSNGRNNIQWKNTVFSFVSGLQLYSLTSKYSSTYNFTYNASYVDQTDSDYGSNYLFLKADPNGYTTTSRYNYYNRNAVAYVYLEIYSSNARGLADYIVNHYTQLQTIFSNNFSIKKSFGSDNFRAYSGYMYIYINPWTPDSYRSNAVYLTKMIFS